MAWDLAALGWDARREAELSALKLEGCLPGRVVERHRGAYRLATARGEWDAQCRRGLGDGGPGFPALGDWVAAEPPRGADRALIRAVLPRRGCFARKKAGEEAAEQVLAANVDVVFVVAALGEDFNPRRLERYLAAVFASGAAPVILLNKTDLVPGFEDELRRSVALAADVPVHPVSAATGAGLDAARARLGPGLTAAFVGSSGAGKSSLINRLLGAEVQKVAEVRRRDEKGRHTTTSGRLIPLPEGGAVVDTAGLRELQLWEAEEGIGAVFEEIEQAAARCRFRDCAHEAEPGCAVRDAVASGAVTAERLESWRKLRRELDRAAVKEDKVLEAQKKRKWKQASRALRRRIDEKRR
jgi:ribosome biogenesis GTPase